jgi:hypothetical protein
MAHVALVDLVSMWASLASVKTPVGLVVWSGGVILAAVFLTFMRRDGAVIASIGKASAWLLVSLLPWAVWMVGVLK